MSPQFPATLGGRPLSPCPVRRANSLAASTVPARTSRVNGDIPTWCIDREHGLDHVECNGTMVIHGLAMPCHTELIHDSGPPPIRGAAAVRAPSGRRPRQHQPDEGTTGVRQHESWGLPRHPVLAGGRRHLRPDRPPRRVGQAAQGAEPRRAGRPARHPAPVNLYDTEVVPATNLPPLHRPRPSTWSSARVDGTYNDLADPRMGTAGTRFGRNIPLDAIVRDSRDDKLRPSPREVSRAPDDPRVAHRGDVGQRAGRRRGCSS